ncbi:MAG: metal-dependent hydrolase [Proteobacteria bacterium]|nr:metal-dependent hydrolase [Pseudomonadota bacterium]
MATAFTHVLVGAGLAAGAPTGVSRLRLALWLGAVAALPDLDVAAFWLGIPYEHALGHRGFTHSPAFAAGLGLILAWVAFPRVPGGLATRLRLAALLAAATASHGLLDAATKGGLGVAFAWPFDDGRWFLPWRPLEVSPVDPRRFFDSRALAILANEARWVWAPLALLLFAGWAGGRFRRRSSLGPPRREEPERIEPYGED